MLIVHTQTCLGSRKMSTYRHWTCILAAILLGVTIGAPVSAKPAVDTYTRTLGGPGAMEALRQMANAPGTPARIREFLFKLLEGEELTAEEWAELAGWLTNGGVGDDPSGGSGGGPGQPTPGKPEQNEGEKGEEISDPIAISTGDFQQVQTDLMIPGRGFDFVFDRMYRSRSGLWSLFYPSSIVAEQPLGYCWDHSYNLRVVEEEVGGGIGFFPGNGRCESFTLDNSPAYSGPGDVYTLDGYQGIIDVDPASRVARYVTGGGLVYTFSPMGAPGTYDGGRLLSIRDKNNNEMLFSYETSDGVERLAQVTDTLQNVITFEYHNHPDSPLADPNRAHLLWTITDHAGRTVEYNYEIVSWDASADIREKEKLIEVVLPAVETTADFPLPDRHARFADGRRWSFEWNSEDRPFNLTHVIGQLGRVISPNGDTIIDTIYDDEGPRSSRTDNRVLEQRYGDGVFNYYTTLSGSDRLPRDLDDPYTVWVNNRAGHVKRFDYTGDDSPIGGKRLLRKVEYVGLATLNDAPTYGVAPASQAGPVSWTANGPGPALRAGDEPFVTEYSYDENWELVRTTLPNRQAVENVRGRAVDVGIDARLSAFLFERSRIADVDAIPLEKITERWARDHTFAGGVQGGACAFATAHVDGNGYVTRYHYDGAGNLLEIWHDLPIGTPLDGGASVQAAAVETFTYNQHGQMLTHTHPPKLLEGRIPHARVDRFEYGTTGNEAGRLTRITLDDGGLNLTTELAYDAIGNIIRVVQPDGDVKRRLYNQHRELVIEECLDPTETIVFASIERYYDANGNVVRKEVLNLDESQAVVASNPTFTTIYSYDLLNDRLEAAIETGVAAAAPIEDDPVARTFVVPSGPAWSNTRFVYDESNYLREIVYPEAADGRQPSNRTTRTYDERGLLLRETRGAGEADEIVTQVNFDSNGRLTQRVVDPDGQPQVFALTYDRFDRPSVFTDPMGNETRMLYDDNDMLVERRVVGQEDDLDPTNSGAVTLAFEHWSYDRRDRVLEWAVGVFDAADELGSTAVPSVLQRTRYEYNADDSLRTMQRQLGPYGFAPTDGVDVFFYDTASRLALQGDALSNAVRYRYDADSNLVEVDVLDASSSGAPVQRFSTRYDYDARDRVVVVREADFAGGFSHTSTFGYDSRDNMVLAVDANGQQVRFGYDGLSRRVTRSVDLTVGAGALNGTPTADGAIDTTWVFDDSSRLTSIVDDNSNATSYQYDGLSRLRTTTMPGGVEVYSYEYDQYGNVDRAVGPRGVVMAATFDIANRVSTRSISGTPVSGTSGEFFTYDGLARVRSAENNSARVTRAYDSRSNVVSESQNLDAAGGFPPAADRIVQYEFDEASNVAAYTYPSGRVVSGRYDALNRLAAFSEGPTPGGSAIASYTYVGPVRMETRTVGAGIVTAVSHNGYEGHVPLGADEGIGLPTRIEHAAVASGSAIDARAFEWDAAGNRLTHDDDRFAYVGRRERTLSYDASNRLAASQSLQPGLSPTPEVTSYELDGVDNRLAVTGASQGGSAVGSYVRTGAGAQLNQYSETPDFVHQYDAGGNMVLFGHPQAGDLNGDFATDVTDFFELSSAFGTGCTADPVSGECVCDPVNGDTGTIEDGRVLGDVDGDCQSNVSDFFAVSGAFGTSSFNATLQYDYRGQLVEFLARDGVVDEQRIRIDYDAFNRRVRTAVFTYGDVETGVDGAGDPIFERTLIDTTVVEHVYGGPDGWHILAEYWIDPVTGEGELIREHVYGIAVDELVLTTTDEDLDGSTVSASGLDGTVYLFQDDAMSVYAATDAAGVVVERYDYGDYGAPMVMAPDGTPREATAIGNAFLHTGRPWVAAMGLYDHRNRWREPTAVLFIQRDPLGYVDGLNLYQYGGLSPLVYGDPYGYYSTAGALFGFHGWDVFKAAWGGAGRGASDGAFVTAYHAADTVSFGILDEATGGLPPSLLFDPSNPGLCGSKWAGRVAGTAAGLATGRATIPRPTRSVPVTRYGTGGGPIQSGQAVVKGTPGLSSYARSGKMQPGFGNQRAAMKDHTTARVPRESLRSISRHNTSHWSDRGPAAVIKNALGQRTYTGPSIRGTHP